MTKTTFLPLLIAAALCTLVCCGHKGEANANTASTDGDEYSIPTETPGVHGLPEYTFSDEVSVAGHTYAYTVHRIASDDLPRVTDDEGMEYADNIFTIHIQRDGKDFVHREFTKTFFADWLSADMLRRGTLDGMVCDTTLQQLCFAVSVFYPQTDLYEPLLLRIDNRGGMTVEKDTRADMQLE